jgi:large subunit ribosomal protein L23
MAIFGSKKNKTPSAKAAEVKEAPATGAAAPSALRGMHSDVIIRPRITEKSGIASESMGVYTFEVRRTATKPMIAGSVKALYKVTPRKVRIVNLPAKKVLVRGRRGVTTATKKALVYLKKGDKIELA